ncbi:MAG: hypothetical protein KH202_07290 [Clostridiales bacterium]|nr:hypothetical protein [Clostridiales bacterium]
MPKKSTADPYPLNNPYYTNFDKGKQSPNSTNFSFLRNNLFTLSVQTANFALRSVRVFASLRDSGCETRRYGGTMGGRQQMQNAAFRAGIKSGHQERVLKAGIKSGHQERTSGQKKRTGAGPKDGRAAEDWAQSGGRAKNAPRDVIRPQRLCA